ncbi:hypothetical protein TNCV_4319941 [Trichonephila clavipes]|nr:hypothetical protein TNCV_4319941 [Trichonephila clavipes]
MDSWRACHAFEPSTAEDPQFRGVMHEQSIDTQTSSRWCGMEVRRGGYLRCRSRHLTMVQNYEEGLQKNSSS